MLILSTYFHTDVVTEHNKWVFISANYRLLIPITAHDIVDDVNNLFTFIRSDLSTQDLGEHKIRIDSDRIAVGGESFGGYCAKLAALYVKPKPKALVTFYGQ